MSRKNCSKSSYICAFILSKKQHSGFYTNFHNSGTAGCRKLPDPSLNHIFNALSIGVQYTFWFQWINFGLKCLMERKNLGGKKIQPYEIIKKSVKNMNDHPSAMYKQVPGDVEKSALASEASRERFSFVRLEKIRRFYITSE